MRWATDWMMLISNQTGEPYLEKYIQSPYIVKGLYPGCKDKPYNKWSGDR